MYTYITDSKIFKVNLSLLNYIFLRIFVLEQMFKYRI